MKNKVETAIVQRKHNLVGRAKSSFVATWNPQPIGKPVVDSRLLTYPFLVRSAEVIKYQALSLEYFLSPRGRLRAWFKLNLALAISLGIIAVIVVPIFLVLASQFSWFAQLFHNAAINLAHAVFWMVVALCIITTSPFVVRWVYQIVRDMYKASQKQSSPED